ncbi:hypothetical protein IDG46_30655, partial [Staphylococcus sp. EG-SA-13]|nr:hypothetical protein [Staphylococcus sp. EG-SA-13]
SKQVSKERLTELSNTSNRQKKALIERVDEQESYSGMNVSELKTAKLTATVPSTASGILDAIEVFDSEDEESYVLHIHPKDY